MSWSINLILIVDALFRLGVAVVLVRLGLRAEARPLHWLAGVMLLSFAHDLLNYFQPGSPGLAALMLSGQICLALFIHLTFSRGARSPLRWVLPVVVLSGAAALALMFLGDSRSLAPDVFDSDASLFRAVGPLLNWGWHLVAAVAAYRAIAADSYVEDWVKVRYVGMILYTTLALLTHALMPVRQFLGGLSPWWGAGMLALSSGSVVIMALVWSAPGCLLRWLNRNYRPPLAQDLARLMDDSTRTIRRNQG